VFCRKSSILNLGTAETKLLYTLHWILLDAAEVQNNNNNNNFNNVENVYNDINNNNY